MAKKNKKRSRKAVAAVKATAAAMANATRGRKTTFQNRKKEQARKACRGTIRCQDDT